LIGNRPLTATFHTTNVMGYIMKRHNNILLIFFLITVDLSAQIVYDTIPDNEIAIGGQYWEELLVFKDFDIQALTYFDRVDFKNLDCYGKTVVVSTIFGKNGELRNTSIVKSASPNCDSVAFHFVNGLKNWIPGLVRGEFVDIPFIFPIKFDSLETKNIYTKAHGFLNTTQEKFEKRKEYFNFIYSTSSQKIVNDFTYFYKYLTEKLSNDSLYVYHFEYTRPNKKNRIRVELSNENTDSVNFIIYYPENPRLINYILAKERWIFYWDKYRWGITPNFTPAKKNGTIYLEKNKKMILLGFVSGKEEPTLAIYNNIIFKRDTIINLTFKQYEKKDLLNVIKYSP